MTRITTITTQKGGVGKTTTALALAEGLRLRGYSVLLVDADQQQNSSGSMRANRDGKGVYEALKGSKAADLIQHTENGDILPATDSLIGADVEFAGKLDVFRKALQPLRKYYDHVIIDTPPSISAIMLAAIAASTDLIIPLGANYYSMQGLEQLLYCLQQVKEATGEEPRIAGLLVTQYAGRKTLAKQMSEALKTRTQALRVHVYETSIRSSAAVEKAQALQTGLFAFDPKSTTAEDYASFIEEYLQQETK